MSPLKQGWALGPVLEPKGKEALCKTLSGGSPLSCPSVFHGLTKEPQSTPCASVPHIKTWFLPLLPV